VSFLDVKGNEKHLIVNNKLGAITRFLKQIPIGSLLCAEYTLSSQARFTCKGFKHKKINTAEYIYTFMVSSTSSTVLGMGVPRTLLPVSVISTSSSILTPPKLRNFSASL
jgi:hypothetical protein